MTRTVTLGQVEELTGALPVHDQQRLIKRISERLAARQDYFARAKAFLKTCLESPVRPVAWMEAGAELAAARGTTENALIEEGLDLLFREQERQTTREEVLAEDLELLRQFDAERAPLPSSRVWIKIDPDEIVSIVGTPIDPATVRRLEG